MRAAPAGAYGCVSVRSSVRARMRAMSVFVRARARAFDVEYMFWVQVNPK